MRTHISTTVGVGLTVNRHGDWLDVIDENGIKVGSAIVGAGPHSPAATDVAAALLVAVSHGMHESPPDPEPAQPLPCSACGRTYEQCNTSLRKPRGRCCCSYCFTTATHNQNAWEAWDRRQKGQA